MQAYVYKSLRKAETFVYLRERDAFGLLPDVLRAQLGELRFVLDVALTPERTLAREDAAVVRRNLADHGFHLQFPPPPLPGSADD
ncbi:MAG: YcgL domain-containing protein [Silanimonas sp.]